MMSTVDSNNIYKVRIIDPEEKESWDSFIDHADNGTLFHKYGWLKAAAAHSNTLFIPLVCEKEGTGLISSFPVFFRKISFLKVLFSPPPGCAIPELGPVFSFSSKRQPSIESASIETIKAFDRFILDKIKPDYINIVSNMEDIRFFVWEKYKASPLYTYQLFLNETLDDIHSSFDQKIRNKIRKADKLGYISFEPGNAEDIKALVRKTSQRYKQKNRSYKPDANYLQELYHLYGGNGLNLCRCYLDNVLLTSFITINYKGRMKFWQGAINDKEIPNGINEAIHWYNINYAHKNNYIYYEHIGANTKHLCAHKSRYGFKPTVHFKVEKWPTIKGRLIYSIYSQIKKGNEQD